MNRFFTALIKPRFYLGLLLLVAIVAILVTLAVSGKLEPWAAYLNSDAMSIVLGGSRFSVFWLIKAVIIVIGAVWFAGLLAQFAERRIHAMEKLRAGNRALLSKILQVLIYLMMFMLAIHALGINIAAFAVIGGTIGIGIGFGLQKITSNFISGMILLFEKSIETGDLIELNNGTLGYVRQTHARYTLIETFDGKEIMVPNEDFIINQVTNLSYSNTRGRVEVQVGVSYGSDTELAREIMLETACNHPRSLEAPAPACYLTAFADSSINLALYFWIADITNDRFGPKSDVMRTILQRFADAGITIPFPQRDVHLIQHNPTTDTP